MTKVLIVRFSSIGDIVLTSPVIRCLKDQLPNAEIHYLTKAQFSGILEPNPNIEKIHTITNDIDEVIEQLKAEHFDYLIDLHRNLRTSRLKVQLRVKSFTFPKLNFQKLILTTFKFNRLPKMHVVDRYFKAVKAINVVNDNMGIDFFLSEEDKQIELPTNFIAIAVGAKFNTKQIPKEKLHEILNQFQTTDVLLLGGKEDWDRGRELASPRDRVISYCGELSLSQSAYVLSKANVVLTGDTGLMHIASAFKVPIVTIWGNTTPAFGMYPYVNEKNDLYRPHEVKLGCRPCSKIGFDQCPKDHFKCMNEQDVEKIVRDLKKLGSIK